MRARVMYTAALFVSFLISSGVDASCQWNGSGGVDVSAQCLSMSQDECGSHAFSRGHDSERCVWIDASSRSVSRSRSHSASSDASNSRSIADDSSRYQTRGSPDPSTFGCIWDGTGGGEADRMAMNCERLNEAECRATESGNKDGRCYWRARVHEGLNDGEGQIYFPKGDSPYDHPSAEMEEKEAVVLKEDVSRWIDENPHEVDREQHKEEHDEKMAQKAAEREDAEQSEYGEEESEYGEDQEQDMESGDIPSAGWWEEPDDDAAYGLPGYQESESQDEEVVDTPIDRDFSKQFDHPRIELPEYPQEAPQQPSVPQQPAVPQEPAVPAEPQRPSLPAPPNQGGASESAESSSSMRFGFNFGVNDPNKPPLTADAMKAGICRWDGTKCNTGDEVSGVFMGCDSSKMINRCAKLQGAQCSGETGKLYACYWDKEGVSAEIESESVIQYESPSVGVVAEVSKVGVCLWNGMGCNTGDSVDGVFMGCDSSKMITRCAKLAGAACEGDQGEKYRCYWDVTGERAGSAHQGHLNADMESTVLTVADIEVTMKDVVLTVSATVTMLFAVYQLYRWWKGELKEVEEEKGAEHEPLMMDLMENRV